MPLSRNKEECQCCLKKSKGEDKGRAVPGQRFVAKDAMEDRSGTCDVSELSGGSKGYQVLGGDWVRLSI